MPQKSDGKACSITADTQRDGSRIELMAYFGHHKCATQYIQAIVQDVCEYLGCSLKVEAIPEKLPNGWQLKEECRLLPSKVVEAISTFDGDFLCHGNATIGLLDSISHKN